MHALYHACTYHAYHACTHPLTHSPTHPLTHSLCTPYCTHTVLTLYSLCTPYCTPYCTHTALHLHSILYQVSYGMLLEWVAFCPCFVDYVGTFKDRTETAGRIVLCVAVLLGFVQLGVAVKVCHHSPFKAQMAFAIINSLLCGVLTGWITYWVVYHLNRSKETGVHETCHECSQRVDMGSMRQAWKTQKDELAYDNPDDNDKSTGAQLA